ncbi:MAG: SCP2 sterol-binding domain-containing protein [Kouleothrix sp.]|nr:SCP2 sterol-binding domain-containing protein [Kouleothrix sp.]
MAEISSPEAYFTRVIPEQYAAGAIGAPAIAEQPDLTAVYEITGEGGGVYALRCTGGQLAALPADQVAGPDLRTVMSYADWRVFAESDATDQFVDYVVRGKVNIVKGLKGTVRLELTRSDGSLWQSATTFNGHQEPAVTVQMTNEDYRAMLGGELNSQMAFLTGKLKFEGSLPLLMQIGALTS